MKLECSLYEAESFKSPKVCVLYLHCNTGNRLDIHPYLKELILNNFGVCCFDFAGCGNSEGNQITLGYKEQFDIEVVLNYLKDLQRYEYFFLWGRSMGAVAALFYIANTKQNLVKAMILDSPFSSLKKAIIEYSNKLTKLPEIFLYPFIPLINKSLKENIGTELNDYEMEEQLHYLNCNKNQSIPSVLFITSKEDSVIKCSHSEKLYEKYPLKRKYIKYIREEHGENRTPKDIINFVEFLCKFRENEEKEKYCSPLISLKINGNCQYNNTSTVFLNPSQQKKGYYDQLSNSVYLKENSFNTYRPNY